MTQVEKTTDYINAVFVNVSDEEMNKIIITELVKDIFHI